MSKNELECNEFTVAHNKMNLDEPKLTGTILIQTLHVCTYVYARWFTS